MAAPAASKLLSDAMLERFRCMMCGHDYQETTDLQEDRERSCPRCRSNSIGVAAANAAKQSARGLILRAWATRRIQARVNGSLNFAVEPV